MRTWLVTAIAVAAVLVVATTAAAVISRDRHGDGHPSTSASTPYGGRAPGGAGPWAWMRDGRVSDEADYLSRMVAHHREAVAAAEQLKRSDRPQMRAFGAHIVATQSAQVREMTAWLHRWYPDRPADTTYQPMMRDLSTLSGKVLDRAFLRDMTIHHMAAVMMSQQLVARGLAVHPQVARLARTIRDQQHAEIFRMQRWLRDWYGQTWHGSHGWMMGRGYRWMHQQPWQSPYRHQGRDHGRWNGDHGGMGPSMMR